jgi:hypothetical protein
MTQTSEQIQRQQQQDAARRRAEEANKDTRPKTKLGFDDIRSGHYDTIRASKPEAPALPLDGAATPGPNTLPVPSGGNAVGTYVDPHAAVDQFVAENDASGGLPRIKFAKEGKFVRSDTEEVIPDTTDFVAPVDQFRVSIVKFNGKGVPPDRIGGLPFDGFALPAVEDRPDRDESQWEHGLSGELEDPWKPSAEMPLQRRDTGEVFIFTTMSPTGRGSVAALVETYRRMLRTSPNDYPVVRLKAGGFESRRKGVGWVNVPRFVVVGRTPRDSVAVPDTSPSADMDDELPF